ncbi:hypothetical protein JQK15_02230 [Sphingobium sp. BHU LFT2]|uniref:surface-adhesin E family protein n=1 Tax=Sphingobium sp. BHU LFT2 TaxID=2807634 RepID=UPI001BE858CA|nr:surface-adhesin E family protein [Sphingobium sp. BHU LFT2]MBT2242344.1 hypothetical protein [Sphingobium sp. BHU LFT2]
MLKKVILTCFGLGAIAAPAHAEWESIGSATNGTEWFMDGNRIKTVSGKKQAWIKLNHSRNKSIQWRETLQLISFDCQAGKYRTLSVISYDSYGKVVSSQNYSDYSYGVGYDPLVPDSMAESASLIACAYGQE